MADGWQEAKAFLEQAGGISMDALHVLVGVLLLPILAGLLGRPVWHARPLLLLLALSLANEGHDFWVERWPSPGAQIGEAAKDVALTMLLPVAIAFSAWRWPALYRGRIDPERAGPAERP